MTDMQTAKSSPVKNWLLPVSLLLNFFVLGVLISTFMPWMHPHMHHMPMIERMTQGLPEEDARKLRQAYENDAPALEQNRAALHAASHKLATALAEPQPDPDTVQQALDDIAAAQNKIQENMADLIRHAASDLSPEGRQILSERGMHAYARHQGD